MPNKRSHEWIQKTTAEEQSEWIEVIESHHQREREKILSFEYCTHYNGPEELCAVKSYALVKLNKGKVFPHEGQMRISKWKCRQMSKSWGRLSAVWPRHLTHILRLQIYSPSLSLSLSLSLSTSTSLGLRVRVWGKPQGLGAASSLKASFHFQDRAGLQYGHCLYTNVALGIMFISITVLEGEKKKKKKKTNKNAELVCTHCFSWNNASPGVLWRNGYFSNHHFTASSRTSAALISCPLTLQWHMIVLWEDLTSKSQAPSSQNHIRNTSTLYFQWTSSR